MSEKKARTLGELFGVEGPMAAQEWPVASKPHELTPAVVARYQFREDQLRAVMLWAMGVAGKNLLVGGPTGSGKSSLIQQYAARVGQGVYRVACHGRLEFADLVGQVCILKDGSTSFVHGPLPRAMTEGAILLLDEFNFLPPGVSGALNTVLDGEPLLIAETGEIVRPHRSFRVAATGNAVDRGDDSPSYVGTQRMNLAMIQRFLTLQVGYMDRMQESRLLHAVAPRLPGKVLTALVELAQDVRGQHAAGGMETTMGTRTLEKCAAILAVREAALRQAPQKTIEETLKLVLTDAIHPAEAHAVMGILQRQTGGMVISEDEWNPTDDQATAGQKTGGSGVEASQEAGPGGIAAFLVNPDRDGKGSAFWVSMTESGQPDTNRVAKVYTGQFNGERRFHAPKDDVEVGHTREDKVLNRGYTEIAVVEFKANMLQAVNETIRAIDTWLSLPAANPSLIGLSRGTAPEVSKICEQIAKRLGGKGTTKFVVNT